MPTVFVHGPKMDKEKKSKLAQMITDATSEVTGLPKPAIVVYFNEYDRDNVSSGGVLVSEK